MICILGGPEDADLLWFAVAARERGHAVEIVLPDELTLQSSLTNRIESASTSWELRLGDGRVLQPEQVSVVVNRLTALPSTADGTLALTDQTFIAEEWRASVVAWLRSMSCPVLNPPRAVSLCGPVMSARAWRAIAHAHGLIAQPHHSGEPYGPVDPVTLTCVGNACIDLEGVGDYDLHRRLVAMAAYVGAPLLEAHFERVGGRLIFCEASAFPALRNIGDPLIDVITEIAGDGRGAS